MRKLFYILIIALAATSCAVDTECRQQIDVLVGIQLKGDSLRLAADSVDYEHVTFNSVRGMEVWGVGRDSLIVTEDNSVQQLRLPLRKDADTTAFVLSYCGMRDTLIFTYTRTDVYVSLACGCAVFSTLDTVSCPSMQFIDSLQILNSAITTAKENHIQLFFHKPQN